MVSTQLTHARRRAWLAVIAVAVVLLVAASLGAFSGTQGSSDDGPELGQPPAAPMPASSTPPEAAERGPDRRAPAPRSASPPATPTRRTLRVTVRDRSNKEPIRAATVTAHVVTEQGLASPEVAAGPRTADDRGEVALEVEVGRRLVLVASAEGYAPARRACRGAAECVIEMDPAGTLRGSVVDARGSPLAGVVVYATTGVDPIRTPQTLRSVREGVHPSEHPASATTAPDGTFQLPALRRGRVYHLSLDPREWRPLAPPKGGDRSGGVRVPAEAVVLRVEHVRYVHVRLASAVAGDPPRILRGTCQLSDKDRNAGESLALRTVLGADSEAAASAILLQVRGDAVVPATLSANGYLPAGAKLRALTWSQVEAGDHDVVTLTPLLNVLRQAFTGTVVVPAASLPKASPQGPSVLVVTLFEGEGRMDASVQQPALRHLESQIDQRFLVVHGERDEAGDLRFPGVPLGTRTLELDLGGLRSARKEVELDARDPTRVTFDLPTSRLLVVEVEGPDGPLLDATIAISRGGDLPVAQPTGPGARHAFVLPEGEVRVNVTRPGYKHAWGEVNGEVRTKGRLVITMEPE